MLSIKLKLRLRKNELQLIRKQLKSMLKKLLNRKLPFKPPKKKLKDLRKKGKKLLV